MISCSGTDRQRFGRDADGDELTLGSRPPTVAAMAFESPAVANTTATPPRSFSASADVAVGGVDVVVRAQFERILFLGGAAVDRDGLETHRPGELHPEVAEPADTENRHPVTGQCLGVAQRVVGRDTGAAHRRGFGVGQLRRYPGQRGRRHRHRFRVAAGILPARHLPVHTM